MVGMELRVERVRQNIRPSQLSKKIGLSRQAIGIIERGQSDAHILNYKRIADALGKPLKDFL